MGSSVGQMIRDTWRDAALALRILKSSPGVTLVAVVSIGLAIGMATGIFSQIQSMMLAPVPGIQAPGELVSSSIPVSFPTYEAFVEDGPFTEVAGYIGTVPLSWSDEKRVSRRIWGQVVTPNYFEVLGAEIQIGRAFSVAETVPVALISDRVWVQNFGADPGVVGEAIWLNGHPATLIGVTGPGFLGATPMIGAADVWVPADPLITFIPELAPGLLADPYRRVFSVVGRLHDDRRAEAEAQLDTILRRFDPLERLEEPTARGRRVSLLNAGRKMPLRDQDLPLVIAVPIFLVFLMLGIAAANVGTMLLARAAGRRQEIAIRLALGATRGRLLRQLLTENMVLALAAGAAGLVFAWGYKYLIDSAIEVVLGESGTAFLNIEPWSIEGRTLVFVLGVALVSGLMFGIAPAFHALRSSVAGSLKPGGGGGFAGFRRLSLRNLLVLFQVAGSLALLLLTGFIVLGVHRTTNLDTGFASDNLVMVSLDPIRDGYSRERAVEFFEGLRDRVKTLPGTVEAALSYEVPFGMRSAGTSVRAKNANLEQLESFLTTVQTRRVGPGFVETLSLPVHRGRPLDATDREVPRVMVNATLAGQMWPSGDALGRTLELGETPHEVTAVLGDLQASGVMNLVVPTAYLLMSEQDLAQPSPYGMTLLVRETPGSRAMDSIHDLLRVSDPDVALFDTTTATDEIAAALYSNQLNMLIYGGIGLFGLLLAAVGVGGITAYAVMQRRKEIAIRVALGARRAHVIGLVTKEATVLIAVGMVAGVGVAYGATRLLGAVFSGLATVTGSTLSDPVLIVGAPLMLALLTLGACYFPARRSLGILPATALKEE